MQDEFMTPEQWIESNDTEQTVRCRSCHGTGSDGWQACQDCNGSGQVDGVFEPYD